MAEKAPYIWMDGAFVRWAEARVHVLSEVVTRGISVFEGIRAYRGRDDLYVFRYAEHMARLAQSMKVLRLRPGHDIEALTEAGLELIRRCDFRDDTYLRPCVYIGEGDAHSHDPAKVFMGAFVTAIERPSLRAMAPGKHFCISSWRRLNDAAMPPRVKASANYLNARLAQVQARIDGYDGSILLRDNGKVSEAPGACIMLVRGDEVVAPHAASDILESITRETLITLARDELGLKVVEREVDRTELYIADEVWMCGTGQEIVPIISVDRLPVGTGEIGPVASRLRTLYFDIVSGEVEQYAHWLRPVYGEKNEICLQSGLEAP